MSRSIPRNAIVLGATLSLALAFATPAAADVKVHGATTVTFGLMKPHKEKIEQLLLASPRFEVVMATADARIFSLNPMLRGGGELVK